MLTALDRRKMQVALGDRDVAKHICDEIDGGGGALLGTGNFALSAGWGSTASKAVAAGSTDGGFTVTVTSAGTGQAANPTVTLTFAAVKATAPFAVASGGPSTGLAAVNNWIVLSVTTTTVTLQYVGTPAAGSTYTVTGIVRG